MIVLGAGASTPFCIPDMKKFTSEFDTQPRDKASQAFLQNIKECLNESPKYVGRKFTYDLETLLSILNDVSTENKKTITAPTFCLLFYLKQDIVTLRSEKKKLAETLTEELNCFIVDKCMEPIKKGADQGEYSFLDIFYGPLMTILNNTPLGTSTLTQEAKKIFSTNWDICFKKWADYINYFLVDGTAIDKQSIPYFDVKTFDRSGENNCFHYIPLHGSIDFIYNSRQKTGGRYSDINKIADPYSYFKNNKENLKNIFMIFPLEAVGYEESIKSPYLDMLSYFKQQAETAQYIFILGYSLRDPTISSILEEVIKNKIRNKEISPLSSDINYRKIQAPEHKFKLIVFSRNPDNINSSLEGQGYMNLQQTFIPIKIDFPNVFDTNFKRDYSIQLTSIMNDLIIIQYIKPESKVPLIEDINRRYSLTIPPR